MSPELKTFLIAMSPIVELRGALPIALTVYKLPFSSAYFFSVLGNLVPLIVIIGCLNPIYNFISSLVSRNQKYRFVPGFVIKIVNLGKRILDWMLSHTRKANESKFKRLGKELAVLILVATPIPFIGGWTGAICAFIFGVSFKKALPLVILGTMLSGLIVALFTMGFSPLF